MRVIERDEKENKFQIHTGAKETETEKKNTERKLVRDRERGAEQENTEQGFGECFGRFFSSLAEVCN